jgi:LPS-assembly lipoprotein
MKIKTLLIILATILLAGCGFHLRKVEVMPKNLSSIYIQTSKPNDQFIQVLQRLLKANHIRIATSSNTAEAILNVTSIQKQNQLDSLTGSAEAGLYSIIEEIKFNVTTQKGIQILPSTTVESKRYYNSNATQILSANAKSEQLTRSMRIQLAQSVLDQLAKAPTPAQTQLTSTP